MYHTWRIAIVMRLLSRNDLVFSLSFTIVKTPIYHNNTFHLSTVWGGREGGASLRSAQRGHCAPCPPPWLRPDIGQTAHAPALPPSG